MYIVNSVINVPEEKVDEVIGIYQSRSRRVDEFEGFESFRLLQNESKPSELTVQMKWKTKESFLTWIKSPSYKEIHDLEKKYPDQELAAIKPKVSRFKVVAE
ncbi:antibiotic biosynthesis monooxygenase [Bacillus hwajinpoensis]|uniref:Antibiotic biosynthesis monooxygenase n=1 Tax=Guptibacillus hwajinpoensis TaxID=208199 RepID=A0A845F5P4_9BACL|nr:MULTISPECIES: antibiotic biosynthesis monooxygenase family protein [Bacillaceae]MCA0993561.1 antibiotic biosynthesis monooxygenase [Pseudalkalibacillus hwajinpoensis]MYL66058.1 antibiotic biosynthesis monooxygenase [Pseudalkalibacillus hwajinpoensis]PFG02765.1 heme-degrading monooxygenase HmoA [Bacillus sp. es.036]